MTVEPGPAPPALECRGLTVGYGTAAVLSGLDLVVAAGEAVAVLGPSGCGKTTLLYTVAGFVAPRAGQLRIGGRSVATAGRGEPPESRDVGVVFQNYALWPHLSALDTVAYPLRRAGQSQAAARSQALALLERAGIAGLADRRPAQLSGGEQQRVGVARALARSAGLYLFDEPTAHLDTALRAVLQEELAEQRASIGAAMLYATHDVAEALAVADRVGLLRDGRIAQLASPDQVYERPVDPWAATLTGPATVLWVPVAPVGRAEAELRLGEHGCLRVRAAFHRPWTTGAGGRMAGESSQVLLRPEWSRLGGPLAGRVRRVHYRGPDTDYRLDTPLGSVEVRERGAPQARVGDSVGWAPQRVWVFDGADSVVPTTACLASPAPPPAQSGPLARS